MDTHQLLERALLLTHMLIVAQQEGKHAFTIDQKFVQELSDDLFETLSND